MRKLFYKTKYTTKPSKGEVTTEPSMTEQGGSMTVREIVARFTAGNSSPEAMRKIIYNDTEDFDSVDMEKYPHLDLMDKEEIKEANKRTLLSAKEKVDKLKALEESSDSGTETKAPVKDKTEGEENKKTEPPVKSDDKGN